MQLSKHLSKWVETSGGKHWLREHTLHIWPGICLRAAVVLNSAGMPEPESQETLVVVSDPAETIRRTDHFDRRDPELV